jgi:hypothetical protein
LIPSSHSSSRACCCVTSCACRVVSCCRRVAMSWCRCCADCDLGASQRD